MILTLLNIWSYLCWVGVLFPGFYCPLWLLGWCGDYVLPTREFWDAAWCVCPLGVLGKI